jgi:methanogenic corrinoid protein MtbC1
MVAPLSDEEAEALLREDLRATIAVASTPAPRSDTGEVVAEALDRIHALDGRGLDHVLRRAAVTLGGHVFLGDVVAPLLRRVGKGWLEERLGVAHEHLCTAVTEDVLAWVAEPAGAGNDTGPVLVVATLPGERHGLGARLAAASAALEGWRVTHLGVDLPVVEISDAARALGARAVAVSVVNPALSTQVVRALTELRQGLPPDVEILVGGGASAALPRKSLPAGAQVVEDLAGLRVALEALGRA